MDDYSHILHDYPWEGRAVLLMDLDAFFASVEQLDHPEWRGKPVIVGGDADKRGVVSTCSYEARAFGVRSAMPASTAARLCPDAIWTHGRFARYREVSQQVMAILLDESPFIQQVSIDEAFLDVTPDAYSSESPVAVARRIQQRVARLGITCSVGLGRSKAVAKVASEQDKPCGMTVVFPGRERDFLRNLPIERMSGIGPVAQETLHRVGIRTLGEVADADADVLQRVFGKNARMMRERCMGADDDAVGDGAPAKSVSNEISFANDLTERADVDAALGTVAAKVARRLRKNGLKAGAVTLKVRYGDRQVRTMTRQLPHPADDDRAFVVQLEDMVGQVWHEGVPIRLLGMAASRLQDAAEPANVQESLFDEAPESFSSVPESRRSEGLANATDLVRDRFGEDAIMFGREIRTKGNLTGSASKNPEDYKKPR